MSLIRLMPKRVIPLTNKIEWETKVEKTLELVLGCDKYNTKLSRDTLRELVEPFLKIEKEMIDLRQLFHQLTHTTSEEVITKAAHNAIEKTTHLLSICQQLAEAIRNVRYEMVEPKGE